MPTSRKTIPATAKKPAVSTPSTTKLPYNPNVLLPDELRIFHAGNSRYSVALGTMKKGQQGGFSEITVPENACDTALKGDISKGFSSISAVFAQLESSSKAPLPRFEVAGKEYEPHKVPKFSNCFYGSGTGIGSKATILAVLTENGYVVIAMVDDWKSALKTVITLAKGLQNYGARN